MALRFIDSFDHYATADILSKWSNNNPAGGDNGFTILAGGRFNNCGRRTGQQGLLKILDSQQTWIIGCAFQATGYGSTPVFWLKDGSTIQIDVRITSAGKLAIVRGNSVTLATGTTVIPINTWNYVELKVTIDNTAGIYELHLNMQTEIAQATSQDTQNSANASADTFGIGEFAVFNGSGSYFDDLYVCDGTGSSPTNTFLGDVHVQCLLPNGNGNSSVLVGQDADSTNNYLNVDESTPNSDTDYNESSTVGDKDTYTYGDLTTVAGTVYGIQLCPFMKKTDAGSRTMATVARLSGTEVDGPNQTLLATYKYFPEIRTTKPGGGAWTITDINNSEFGIKVTS